MKNRGFTPLETTEQPLEIKRSLTGFTLIELLISSVVISVIALAGYFSLAAGIRVWQRVNQKAEYEDLAFFFDRFGYDLRNCLEFSTISFSGSKDRISFAALLNSPRLNKRTVGEMGYIYKAQEGVLSRQERDYSHLYNQDEGVIRPSLANIKSLEFKFYIYDQAEKKYLWLEEFDRDGLPLAVRIELELEGGGEKVARTFNVPFKRDF